MIWIKDLLRIKQWYKNIIAFLVLIFLGINFEFNMLYNLIIAFISLSFMSSANYIINDIVDKEKDKLDKIKSLRPLPSGKISVISASIVASVLVGLSLFLGLYINRLFVSLLIGFFILTQLYSFWLKNKVFLDVIMISVNFMIRALAGAVAVGVFITPWFICGVFFLAMYLVFTKRYGESVDGITKNRATLKFYTPELTQMFMITFMAILIVFYTLYVILNHSSYWFTLTVPLFSFLLLRYFMIALQNSSLARHMEKMLLRKDLLIIGFIWALVYMFALFKPEIYAFIGGF